VGGPARQAEWSNRPGARLTRFANQGALAAPGLPSHPVPEVPAETSEAGAAQGRATRRPATGEPCSAPWNLRVWQSGPAILALPRSASCLFVLSFRRP
jgi:hypothetical protein